MSTQTCVEPQQTVSRVNPVFHFGEAGKSPTGPDTRSEETGITTNGWYFWDETWAFAYGPYGSEVGAQESLCEYTKGL